MSADLRTIARFSDPVEAELACARLVDEGLNAVIAGDVSGNMLGLGFATGGIEVLVPAAEMDRAVTVLTDLAKEIEARKHRPPEAITASPPPLEMDEEQPTRQDRAARPTHSEYLTERAFRASLVGFLVCPAVPVAHVYALLLLLYVAFSGGETRGGSAARYYTAFALSAAWVAIWTASVLQFVGPNVFAFIAAANVATAMFLFTILSPWKRK